MFMYYEVVTQTPDSSFFSVSDNCFHELIQNEKKSIDIQNVLDNYFITTRH